MRVFSSNIQSVLNSNKIDFFFLIKLDFNRPNDAFDANKVKRFSNLPKNIEFNTEIYQGSSGLFEYDSPKFSSVVDREAYKVVLTDLINEISTEMRNNIVGHDIEVRVGFLDSNGEPYLSVQDVLLVYKGFIDRPILQSTQENKLAILEGTSPMADLDMVRSFMSSKAGMGLRSGIDVQGNPTDTSFNFIYDNEEIMIRWGKI